MDITFIKTNFEVPNIYNPIPAKNCIPEWYKNAEGYKDSQAPVSEEGVTKGTIKKCMPIFDALSSGYIIQSYVDVKVSIEKIDGKNEQQFQWPSLLPLQWHEREQVPDDYPSTYFYPYSIPKWINIWGIKTPPGYSTLFIPPVHRPSEFSILPGVVDTDTYSNPVNFPFTFNRPDFEGIIPAGTPIVQVIPFKRETWEMKFGDEKTFREQNEQYFLLKSKIFDSYKKQFRQKKEYN